MGVAPDKTRVSIVIGKSEKEALEELAVKDERSLNYLINKAIQEYLKNHS